MRQYDNLTIRQCDNDSERREKSVKDLERITNPNTITWRIKKIRHDGQFENLTMRQFENDG
jgi:hypothetical protein